MEDIAATLASLHPETNARFSRSDMGNGYLFADVFKDTARYVPERKKWFVYDGVRWMQDTGDLRVMALCKRLADALVVHALTIQDENAQNDYLEFAKTWRRRNRREAIIKDAASVYPVSIAGFDTDPYVFNCTNGTLNLQTGAFKKHTPDDWLSKVSGVAYSPAARGERWERFVDGVMQSDTDKAAFLQ